MPETIALLIERGNITKEEVREKLAALSERAAVLAAVNHPATAKRLLSLMNLLFEEWDKFVSTLPQTSFSEEEIRERAYGFINTMQEISTHPYDEEIVKEMVCEEDEVRNEIRELLLRAGALLEDVELSSTSAVLYQKLDELESRAEIKRAISFSTLEHVRSLLYDFILEIQRIS